MQSTSWNAPRGFCYFLAMLEKIALFILKKNILITLVVIEISGIAALICTLAKQNDYQYKGFIIDDKFLNALAMNEFYKTLGEVLMFFDGFLLMAIILYIIAYVKFKKNTLYPDNNNVLLVATIFFASAIILPYSTISDLLSRKSEKPLVKVENIVDKNIDSYKSSKSYYLIFSSGSKYKVHKNTFYKSHTGTARYTVYQGKKIIHIFPIDTYTLKKN